MSENDRTKKCDCWLQLDYCPCNCNENRKHLKPIDSDKVFSTSIGCFGEMRTPHIAKQIYVDYEEIKTAPDKEDGSN